MLNVGSAKVRNCEGVTRRELIQVGGAGALGLTLANWFAGSEARAASSVSAADVGDVACIFLWMDGGPSHFETFDPKPHAPAEIRGPYGAIPTNVPGVHLSELLPMLAQRMDKCALIRSMSHGNGGHSPIPMMTGFNGDRTAYGAVVTKLKGFRGSMPPYVHLGSDLGVGGGSLGSAYDPVKLADPVGKKVELPQFTLAAGMTPEHFSQRRQLLGALDRVRAGAEADETLASLDRFHRRAFDILTSTKVRDAFDLKREPDTLRDRYGANFFGQSCLMARRLVEAGSRFVQVKWYDGPAWDGWDVHGADLGGMERMEQHLCPRFDQGVTALIDDLIDRGMYKSTLVVAVGEFGRTPKINKYGARDHWPNCFSALLAGGGAPGGAVVGASDDTGSSPAHRPVSPPEFAATIYRLLGFGITTDQRIQPFLRGALPVGELF
jgi:Protein of unknown function (DUF1501)